MSTSSERTLGRGAIVRGLESAATTVPTLDRDLSTLAFESFDPARIDAARDRGYREGFEQGRADGFASAVVESRAQIQAQVDAVRRQLGAVLVRLRDELHQVEGREATLLRATEAAVVDMAFALAQAVLERELATAADPGREAIARALALVGTDVAMLRVRLHPDDLDRLGAVEDLALGRHLELVADSDIEPGGCVVDAGNCSIDAQIGPALARAAAVIAEAGR